MSSGALATNFSLASLASTRLIIGVGLGQFLVEPRLLGGKIDHSLEGQRRDLAAHQKLHRAFRRFLREIVPETLASRFKESSQSLALRRVASEGFTNTS